MSEAMLVAENLSAWYGAARILYDLSFEVGRGEVVAARARRRRAGSRPRVRVLP